MDIYSLGLRELGRDKQLFNLLKKFSNNIPNANIEERIRNNNYPDFLVINPTYLNRSNAKNLSQRLPSKRCDNKNRSNQAYKKLSCSKIY